MRAGSSATFLCLLLIVFIGFNFRYVMISETAVYVQVRDDAAQYLSYALNMHFNHIYSKEMPIVVKSNGSVVIKEDVSPDALRNPGYPLFILLFVGNKPLESILKNLYFSQVILSVLTILVVFLILKNLLPAVFALSGAFLVAISPHLIVSNIYILSESLFVFVLSILILSLVYTVKTGLFRHALISGLMLGAALMVRPTLSYFIWFLLPYMFVVFNRRRSAVVCCGILIGYFLVYAPWAVRNLMVFGAINPSSLAVESIHNGMYLGFMYDSIPESYGQPYAYVPNFEEVQSMSTVLDIFVEKFIEQPLEYILWYCFEKPKIFLSWDIIQGMGDVFIYPVITSPYDNVTSFSLTHSIMKSIKPIINVLAITGMIIVWFSPKSIRLSKETTDAGRVLSLVFFYFLLVHVVATPLPRYAIPVLPVMYCLSMITVFVMYNIALKSQMAGSEQK